MSIILLFAGLFQGDLSHVLHAAHDSGIFAVIFYIIGTLLCLAIPVYLSKFTLRNVLPEFSWKSDYRKLIEGYAVVAVFFFVFYFFYGLFFSKESANHISQLGNGNLLKCLSHIFNKNSTEILLNGYSNKKIITFVLVALSHLYICGFDYITHQILTTEGETNPALDIGKPNRK